MGVLPRPQFIQPDRWQVRNKLFICCSIWYEEQLSRAQAREVRRLLRGIKGVGRLKVAKKRTVIVAPIKIWSMLNQARQTLIGRLRPTLLYEGTCHIEQEVDERVFTLRMLIDDPLSEIDWLVVAETLRKTLPEAVDVDRKTKTVTVSFTPCTLDEAKQKMLDLAFLLGVHLYHVGGMEQKPHMNS